MKKRFIEWDLPLADISEEAAKEKTIKHGHPSNMHIWWSRKPTALSRAIIFSALIDLPEYSKNTEQEKKEREEIRRLIVDISSWKAIEGKNDDVFKKVKEKIQNQYGDLRLKFLDPFAGGGSIPLEALRLGCETYSSDLNPVAVFIQKALMEWPQVLKKIKLNIMTSSNNCLDEFIEQVFKETKNELNRFYKVNDGEGWYPSNYYWIKTISCINSLCRTEIPLTSQTWLSTKKGRNIAYKIIPDKKQNKIIYQIVENKNIDFDPKEGTLRRSNAKCPLCGEVIVASKIRELAQSGLLRDKMLIVILQHVQSRSKKYRLANDYDQKLLHEAEIYLANKIKNWQWKENPLPVEELPYLRSIFNVHLYGITNWSQLYNPRQLLAMLSFMEKIKMCYEKQLKLLDNEKMREVIYGYLCLMHSKISAWLTKLNPWQFHMESAGIVFVRQALGMLWNYCEINPFVTRWKSQYNEIKLSLPRLQINNDRLHINQLDATNLPYEDDYFDIICTDPPYYDLIPYANLSDFFYVWLKRTSNAIFSEMFATPLSPKKDEIIQLADRNKDYQYKTKEFFEKKLFASFSEICRLLKHDGIAIIFYSYPNIKGWESVLSALIKSGLMLTASWPINTSMKTRMRATGSAVLNTSICMVCRKVKKEKIGFLTELKEQIKVRIEEKLKQFWNEGISGGDFFISAIGPGMEIFSRYEKVEKFSGEQVSTIELLDYIRKISTDWITKQLLHGAESSNIDKEAQFYLAYRWTYLENSVPFDDALKLANASGIDITQYWDKDGFIKKKGSDIGVLGPKERKSIKEIKNMVDAMHVAVQCWEKGDKKKLTETLSLNGYQQNNAFWQFCQAASECLLDTSKEKTLLQGFLLGKEAMIKETTPNEKQQKMF